MVSLLLSMCSGGLMGSFFSILLVLALAVPFTMMYLYKQVAYVEDVFFCMNDMNSMLMFMTVSLTLLIYLSSQFFTMNLYNSVLFLLTIIVLLCFMTSNLLWFYIMFESSLIPILVMIIGWGYQPERLQAGLYMIMYTVFGSMPLFIIILYMGAWYGTFNIYMLNMKTVTVFSWAFFLGYVAFLVKLPVWVMHVWLPKAHVEAPLGGSMILAGALLKLGGYGIYLYTMMWDSSMSSWVSMCILSFSLWGGLCASFVCLSQSDIKCMIAYSSVVHMSLVVLGVFSYTSWGFNCALITMVAHGWVSSALFLVAYLTYEKVGSRSFNYTKGILFFYPILSVGWFFLSLVNMAVPPSINLIGELAAVPSAFIVNPWLMLVVGAIMFMSVSYNMFMYAKVNHGAPSLLLRSGLGVTSRGMLVLSLHFMPLLFILSMDLMSPYTVTCM